MTRLKPKSVIASQAQFEETLDNVVTMQLAKERLELKRDKKILEVRDEYEPEIKDLAQIIQANVNLAEKFAVDHRDELLAGKRKTAQTKFTFFGFRTGNPTLVLLSRKWTWKKVVEQVKALGWIKFIQTKESVDKDAMKANCSAEQLASAGVRVEQSEVFFIDPKRDPADPQRLVSTSPDRAEQKVAA
jgi:phage host-nuclease inhibitor protein Gam